MPKPKTAFRLLAILVLFGGCQCRDEGCPASVAGPPEGAKLLEMAPSLDVDLAAMVNCLACSRDGRRIAVGLETEPGIVLLDGESGRRVCKLRRRSERPYRMEFSWDGRYLASACLEHVVLLWDVERGVLMRSLPEDDCGGGLVFSPKGDCLYSASPIPGVVRRFAVESGDAKTVFRVREATSLSEPKRHISGLAISPDGGILACGTFSGVILFDLERERERLGIRPSVEECPSVNFSPDGRLLAGTTYQMIEVWETASGRRTACIRRPNASFSLSGAMFLSDGAAVASPFLGTVHDAAYLLVWRYGIDSPPIAVKCQEGLTANMEGIPGTYRVVTGGADRHVRVWDLAAAVEALSEKVTSQ